MVGLGKTATASADVDREEISGGARTACVVVALDAERPLAPPWKLALGGIESVQFCRANGAATIDRVRGERGDSLCVGVIDRWMSATHAWLRASGGGWVLEDAGSKNRTLVNGTPIERAQLADGDVIEMGHTFMVFRGSCAGDAHPHEKGRVIIETQNGELAQRLRALERIAPTSVSLVVRGETGTGKEVVTRAVHALSGRPGPLVAVNCAALPAALMESELFGHRKGSFSGALQDRPGLMRSADRGTLFLDEIGDLPLAHQATLLRALQEREVLPIGAVKAVPIDIRLIVATHRDLSAMAAHGEFRPDLLARLSGFIFGLPPLRERREDIGLLIGTMLRRHFDVRAATVTLSLRAARALMQHPWPLNVRQLEKALEAAAPLANLGRIALEHLPQDIQSPMPIAGPGLPVTPRQLGPRDQQRRDQLVELLAAKKGNVAAVARELGKARMQVQRWLKRYGLEAASFRT